MQTNQERQTLKGFRDFLGQDAAKRQWLLMSVKKTFETFGFEPLETPALEYESLLLGKYGAEAEKLIYRFEDNGKRRIALRYDQTVPTARVIAQYQNDIVMPYRRYQIQPVWRADKPQKGRYREFLQCDADIIGSPDELSDAEILAVYYSIYKNIGLNSIQLKVNDRAQLVDTISAFGISDENVPSIIQTIDKLDKKSKDDVAEELKQKGVDNGMELLEKLSQLSPSDSLSSILKKAVALGVPENVFMFAPELARGLDYYTGMIFEGIIPEYEVGSVGGGGRYDNLINDLVQIDQPAVGFGLGFDRTLEAAEQLGCIPDDMTNSKVLVTIFDETLAEDSLKAASFLRDNGISVECYPSTSTKIQKQMKYANRKNIPFVIIVGPEEKAEGKVQLKNMQSGEQKTLTLEDVLQSL